MKIQIENVLLKYCKKIAKNLQKYLKNIMKIMGKKCETLQINCKNNAKIL